jgi:putative transposase
MPRRPRIYVKGFPYHLVQRGNNREACFLEPENYQCYLELWREISSRYCVAVHAYCLMTNHVHFLETPDDYSGISNTTKVVGSRYAQYVNARYSRSGTMWEGRHRASLIQTERYFLTCCRYIELNPVRAGLVKRPEEYQWSSYGVNGWGDESWLTAHAEYLRLGRGREKRCTGYRNLFAERISEEDLHLLRKAVHYCQPVGDDRFRRQIEDKYGVRLGQMRRGRPRKVAEELVNV